MPLSNDELVDLYRDTVADLYGFVARRVGGDRALAEDIVQETYCRAVGAWIDADLPDRPLAWLRTVAANLIWSYFRRARPRPVATQDLDAWLADRRTAAPSDAAALVQWGLARIRPDRARLLQAFYFDGCSTKHLAVEHGASEKAIERRVARAREALKRHLARHITIRAGAPPAREDHPDGIDGTGRQVHAKP